MSEVETTNRELKLQTLRYLIKDLEFFDRYSPYLYDFFIQDKTLYTVFDIILTLRSKGNLELNKNDLKSFLTEDNYSKEVSEVIDEIFSLTPAKKNIVEEKIKDEIYYIRIYKALKKSIERLSSKQYELIKAEIERAFDINIGEEEGAKLSEDFIKSFVDRYRSRYSPEALIKTGFEKYDRILMGGMGRGEVHLLIAPPKMGKSTFAVNVGFNVLKQNKAVIHITLELSEDEIMAKYFCLMANITYEDLLHMHKDIIDKRLEMFYRDHQPELFVKYFTGKSITTENIKSYITTLRANKEIKKDIGLIIIDYDDLLLPTTGERDMYLSSGDILDDMIRLGNYFNCPIYTLSQPKREAWTKAFRGELIMGEDISHSALKVHKAHSITTLNRTSKTSYILHADLIRRGESGEQVKLKADLSKAKFYEV